MQIEKAITRFCVAKGIEASKERIDIHASYLRRSNFPEDEIVKAIGELFGETQFFPDASMILKKLKPNTQDYEIEAEILASKILEANKLFGSHDIEGLKSYVGLSGYRVIERFGGWDCIMRLSYDELNTARAQLKRIALSQVRVKNNKPKLEYSRSEKAEGLKRIDFRDLTNG